MSVVRRMFCCCLGGGNLADLKRVRPPKVSKKSGKQPEFVKGEWKDNQQNGNGELKADVDLDVEPDVVTSHKGEEHPSQEEDTSYKNTVEITVNNETPTITVEEVDDVQTTPDADECHSLPEVEVDVCDFDTSVVPVEEEMVETRVVKDVEMSPDLNRDSVHDSTSLKSSESSIVTADSSETSSRVVTTTGLTLSIDRTPVITDEVPSSPTSQSSSLDGSVSAGKKKKGSRKLFQLRHNSSSDTATSPSADKVLLVRRHQDKKDKAKKKAEEKASTPALTFKKKVGSGPNQVYRNAKARSQTTNQHLRLWTDQNPQPPSPSLGKKLRNSFRKKSSPSK